MTKITLFFVRIWPIYDVIHRQRYSCMLHTVFSLLFLFLLFFTLLVV